MPLPKDPIHILANNTRLSWVPHKPPYVFLKRDVGDPVRTLCGDKPIRRRSSQNHEFPRGVGTLQPQTIDYELIKDVDSPPPNVCKQCFQKAKDFGLGSDLSDPQIQNPDFLDPNTVPPWV